MITARDRRVLEADVGEGFGADTPSHVLTVPVSDQQTWEVTSAFIRGGLAAGEQVSYYDDGTAAHVIERLLDDGLAVGPPMRSGQLQVVPSEVTREALMAPLDALGGVLESSVGAALEAGWAGLRFTGNMSYGLQRPGGVVLPEYDRILDRVAAGGPVHALCVYDEVRFPPWLIGRMRELHGTEVRTRTLYDDALLRVTPGRADSVRLAGEIDHSNGQQVRRTLAPLLDRALRAGSGPSQIVLDLTSLRFCDVATAVSVVHAAEEFPSTHRLVLAGVQPMLARLLERVGAWRAAQLDVRTRERPELPELP